MKYKTLWMPQVEAFIKSLAPEPRQAILRAVKQLALGRTHGLDTRALEARLQGYFRLRVATYRVIYTVETSPRGPTLILVAAGPRSTIYEAFERILLERSAG